MPVDNQRANVLWLDDAIGALFDKLHEHNLQDNTLVFFSSDNGPVPNYGGTSGGLRGGKRSEYEGGIRVPLIANWPGKIEPGMNHDLVDASDFLPTLAELSGKKLSRDDILGELRGIDAAILTRSVDIMISRLRQKLGDSVKPPRFIQTVWGRGYSFIGVPLSDD